MTRRRALAFAAASLMFGLLAADAALAQPRPRAQAGPLAATPAASMVAAPQADEGEGDGFLYNQLDHATGEGAPDQDFETSMDLYDAEAADDFTVDFEHGWDVAWVRTVGTTDGVAASVDLAIHLDDAGLPATAVCVHEGLAPVEEAGSFTLALPEPCHLPAGKYWLKVQTNQDYAPHGQHFWSTRALQAGVSGIWRNPGDGFETGCVAWSLQQSCGVGDSRGPDYLFAIGGELGHAPEGPAPEAVPALAWPGLFALIALLAAAGAFAMRRQ